MGIMVSDDNIKAQDRKAPEKELPEKKPQEKKTQEKKMQEKNLQEKKQQEKKTQEKNLQEKKAQEKEERDMKAQQRREQRKKEQEIRAQEKKEQEHRTQEKKAQDKREFEKWAQDRRAQERKKQEKAESGKTAYDRVLAARSKDRMTGLDYIHGMFTGFIELHGDRRFADDPAIIGGLAYLGDIPVTVIATEKGRDTKTRIKRNFGTPNPEGYRKALRLMKQAEKFRRPVICLIDTSGAFCGIGAEERGQGHAIAENLAEMSVLKTPVLSVLIGEGGSGGALALAVADEVWMLENAVYSVISPEGCANILWRDPEKASEAAQSLKLTAENAEELGIVEKIIPEYSKNHGMQLSNLRSEIMRWYEKASLLTREEIITRRYERFRGIGAYSKALSASSGKIL